MANKSKNKCLIFKVDFENAYDSVNQGAWDYMMRLFRFSDVWMGWVQKRVFLGSLYVLINGIPTEEINIHQGSKTR